ncbi:hypothetical protein A2X44_04415 [candidate division CPR3 bacterium GWF2_35_18]|nr:MAG: hypothetical protein A2X44_04415 [candidate division CPR3 bacterium GWF2_35_18]OGB65883.1 MAG: hypothetical protein A2250_01665 [candidate division CPR3 bacterium RIFOXYA2_FULL_35_13]OGB76688.1 MAG: hypothetical protein A2476_03465 [candidate division CPR3 bacterium RIFOXYC2_FULL_35_7]OGB78856.1 MAG: hypothetical protein A2296_05175 [candidate division CPR3 bacterium RIFOXYB2_FULL_35_8]OGB80030.1 MAG: hypothetical protein A2011_00020 [candidate division CPR3 bacterium GWE2_35_7]
MFTQIAYYPILGKPLIFYLGILAISSLLFTASIVPLNKKGFWKIPFKYHPLMAKVTITFALIHGILAILTNL